MLAALPMLFGAVWLVGLRRPEGSNEPARAHAAAARAVSASAADHEDGAWLGVIVAGYSTDVGAEVSGSVHEVWVTVGAHVKAGAQLLRIDASATDGDLRAARAKLEQQRSAVERAEADLRKPPTSSRACRRSKAAFRRARCWPRARANSNRRRRCAKRGPASACTKPTSASRSRAIKSTSCARRSTASWSSVSSIPVRWSCPGRWSRASSTAITMRLRDAAGPSARVRRRSARASRARGPRADS